MIVFSKLTSNAEDHLAIQFGSLRKQHHIINRKHTQRDKTCPHLANLRHGDEKRNESHDKRHHKRKNDGLPGHLVAYNNPHLFANAVSHAFAIGHNDLFRLILTRANALGMASGTCGTLNKADGNLMTLYFDNTTIVRNIFHL